MLTEKEIARTPKKLLAKMQVARLGSIAFILQFITFATIVLSFITFLAIAVYYLFLVAFVILTFFMILFSSDFYDWWNAGENFFNFSVMIANWWVYTAPITIVFSVVCIACLSTERNTKNVIKIGISAVVAVVSLIFLIANLIQMGVFA